MNQGPLRILLADDDDDDQLFFNDAIEEVKVNTKVAIVNNGVELMDYLNQSDVELQNLIFLDLNMPRKGGIECLKEIKSNKKFKYISIAIYSTSSSQNDI